MKIYFNNCKICKRDFVPTNPLNTHFCSEKCRRTSRDIKRQHSPKRLAWLEKYRSTPKFKEKQKEMMKDYWKNKIEKAYHKGFYEGTLAMTPKQGNNPNPLIKGNKDVPDHYKYPKILVAPSK